METTVLLEDPEALDAEMIQEDEAAAKREAERHRPGLTMFKDGSRLDSGATGQWVRGRMAEWSSLGGYQNPHGLQSGSLRRRMCRPRQGTGNRGKATDDAGEGHHLH
jgi:hypothetical protein